MALLTCVRRRVRTKRIRCRIIALYWSGLLTATERPECLNVASSPDLRRVV